MAHPSTRVLHDWQEPSLKTYPESHSVQTVVLEHFLQFAILLAQLTHLSASTISVAKQLQEIESELTVNVSEHLEQVTESDPALG